MSNLDLLNFHPGDHCSLSLLLFLLFHLFTRPFRGVPRLLISQDDGKDPQCHFPGPAWCAPTYFFSHTGLLSFLTPLSHSSPWKNPILSSWESSLSLDQLIPHEQHSECTPLLAAPTKWRFPSICEFWKINSWLLQLDHNFLGGSNCVFFLALPLNPQHLALCLAHHEYPINVE